MKLSKELQWLEPYVQDAKTIIPKVRYIRRITARTPDLKRVQSCHGIITKYSGGLEYRISLYMKYQSITSYNPFIMKLQKYSKIDQLKMLAHEIAHIEHWEHTPQHVILSAQLATMFMLRLKKGGYKSEEDEVLDKCREF